MEIRGKKKVRKTGYGGKRKEEMKEDRGKGWEGGWKKNKLVHV